MPKPLIIIDNIKKTYKSNGEDVNVLKGISLNICKGESVAIMGQSGSGKSTLLSILGGLNPPTTGRIIIDDIDLYNLSQEKRSDFRREYLGFVFQQFQLIPYLTALENVMLPLTTTNYSAKIKLEKAEKVLEQVGLIEARHRLPNQLAGGEQERVAIARAIVNEPPLILADEPTGSLDTKTGNSIMDLFQELNESGLTILMVTHNPRNTSYMKQTVTMKDGLLRLENEDFLPNEPDIKVMYGGIV